MPQLIVQADDIAITHGTTLGVLDAITDGIVRATGMFTNRPDAPFAASHLRLLTGVDIGIDLNFVTGAPVLPPAEVPALVNDSGRFRTSGEIRAAHRLIGGDAIYGEYDVDPFDFDQTAAEAHAQVERFYQLMGRPPAYVHHHSLVSTNSDEIVRRAAAELSVPFVDDLYRTGMLPMLANDWYTTPFPLEVQATADAAGAIHRLLPTILENQVSLLITHPGYVDGEILDLSSYSIIRARDLELVTSREARTVLADAGIEITSFTASGIAPASTTR